MERVLVLRALRQPRWLRPRRAPCAARAAAAHRQVAALAPLAAVHTGNGAHGRVRHNCRCPQIEQFVDELSNWYVRRNRRRYWGSEMSMDKEAVYSAHEALVTVAMLAAPFTPFIARRSSAT